MQKKNLASPGATKPVILSLIFSPFCSATPWNRTVLYLFFIACRSSSNERHSTWCCIMFNTEGMKLRKLLNSAGREWFETGEVFLFSSWFHFRFLDVSKVILTQDSLAGSWIHSQKHNITLTTLVNRNYQYYLRTADRYVCYSTVIYTYQ